MSATGIKRSVDKLGRLVIPIEYRRLFNIETDTVLEILAENGSIVLKPDTDGRCRFCGRTKNVEKIDGVPICASCAARIAEAVK